MAEEQEAAANAPRRRGLRWWRLVPLVLFLAVAAAFLAGLGDEDRDVLQSALISKPAPEFSLESLRAGEPDFDTAVLREPGVKLVNIWASWCGPCRVEHPALMALKERGVKVHGVNYKDDREKALKFLADLGDPFERVGRDAAGRASIDWGVYGVPETFVIDGDGQIAYKHVGPIQNDDLERLILPAIERAGG